MGSPKEVGAASVSPPFDMYVLATATSSTAIKLPAVFEGKNVTFVAESEGVWIRFGTATLTVDETAVSTVTSNVPAVATNGAFFIAADTKADFDMRNVVSVDPISVGGSADDIWFAHKAASANGFLRFYPSEADVANQS